MPAYIDKITAHLVAKFDIRSDNAAAELEQIAREVIDQLGFHVADDGTVCDPRPRPVVNFPEQNWRARRRFR